MHQASASSGTESEYITQRKHSARRRACEETAVAARRIEGRGVIPDVVNSVTVIITSALRAYKGGHLALQADMPGYKLSITVLPRTWHVFSQFICSHLEPQNLRGGQAALAACHRRFQLLSCVYHQTVLWRVFDLERYSSQHFHISTQICDGNAW
ncbi:uncharacterized protein LAESUDRAFT_714004 [Laetiporus sulphureus 93-53]|uniref:Uncharacterized protein n=1 Tax=Laetiporus sulphureus 93-53 TaxID=1314785 RepID=A0A165EEE7_9APHY|nr:uncharacterized protein LAESUDRAFT_714004 [Laetiporus sulphureus 93-53]KZT06871.1 hypothetical protein LAESUDRAFT_714004 [Laetiporus sulphureus 93-53]